MPSPYFDELRRVFSTDRVDAYATSADTDASAQVDLFGRYFWNLAVSAALYPLLHCFEVALRNSLNEAIATRYGVTNWYDDTEILMTTNGLQMVAKAKGELIRDGRPLTPGYVVSRLQFGFWEHLFNTPFEQQGTARPKPLWPILLPDVFPHATAAERTRRNAQEQVDRVRNLRNRIFHQEPVARNLPRLSAAVESIYLVLGWISTDATDYIWSLDQASVLIARGEGPHTVHLASHCSTVGHALA